MIHKSLFYLFFPTFIVSSLFAQEKIKTTLLDEITVTANRIETIYKHTASSITVITAEEIESKNQFLILDILKSVPSLDVTQLGGPGSQTSIFMRGANSNQVLVLIDGVEANDPISPGRAFDFASLTTDNVERIEILRGPQSTLYGSDAMAGIINIITKKGSGSPSFTITNEVGSRSTLQNSLVIRGGYEKINYSVSASRFETDGISSASSSLGNTEKDGYKNSTFTANLGFTPDSNTEINSTFRFLDNKADIDNGGGEGRDDPNNVLETEQSYFRLQVKNTVFDGKVSNKIGFSYTTVNRENRNDTDIDHPDSHFRSVSEGIAKKLDFLSVVRFSESNTLILGIETEDETGSSERTGDFPSEFKEKSVKTNGFYIQDKIDIRDSFHTTIGIRMDDHDLFGAHVTYRIAPVYMFNSSLTKIKGTYGTGFKAPSLFQLYSSFGSEDLEPDESKGWDIGVEQFFLDAQFMIGLTYYSNEFDNLIDFDLSTFVYNNIGKSSTNGIELVSVLTADNGLNIRANYTFTDTEDKSTGEEFIRRAKHKFGLDIIYSFIEKLSSNLSLNFIGQRRDSDFSTFPAETVFLKSYLLINLSGSYDINERWLVTAKIDNLFDQEHEAALGFGSYGITPYIGLKIKIN